MFLKAIAIKKLLDEPIFCGKLQNNGERLKLERNIFARPFYVGSHRDAAHFAVAVGSTANSGWSIK